MYVFIDDSGDAGFKFDSGSTSHLVMGAVIFREPEHAQAAWECIEECSRHNRQKTEFKYSKTKNRVKDCFFNCIKECTFSVRTIVIDKANLRSSNLRENPSILKNYAIRMLLARNYGRIRDAKVVIDGLVDDGICTAHMCNSTLFCGATHSHVGAHGVSWVANVHMWD